MALQTVKTMDLGKMGAISSLPDSGAGPVSFTIISITDTGG